MDEKSALSVVMKSECMDGEIGLDETLCMCRIIGICAFGACSKALFCLRTTCIYPKYWEGRA